MQYYGNRLSENISRREPEGYLLCLNVPVARTGTQDYLPEELGLASGPGFISVYRPEEEVFAPETIASFEGMPVTNDHPPDGVDVDNIRRLQMGHAHNIRRGTGEESDLLLADLIITDEHLIEAILNGKREISCGYTYELSEENGQYIQRKIRGNHVAVVDAGRAGHRVSIKDRKPNERSSVSMKKALTKLLARMAKDGDVEAVAEFIEEMIEGEPINGSATGASAAEAVAEVVEEVAEAAAEPAVTVETPEGAEVTVDEASIAGIIERLDKLIELLTPAPAASDEDPEELNNAESTGLCAEEVAEVIEEVIEAVEEAEEIPGEPIAEEVAEMVEAILEPETSTTIGEAEGDEDPEDPDETCGNDALRAALQTAAPVLAKMSRKQRKKAAADIAARVKKSRRKTANRGYDSVNQAKKAPDAAYAALGKRIMAARNANYHQ